MKHYDQWRQQQGTPKSRLNKLHGKYLEAQFRIRQGLANIKEVKRSPRSS
jgi:hypothetical protein